MQVGSCGVIFQTRQDGKVYTTRKASTVAGILNTNGIYDCNMYINKFLGNKVQLISECDMQFWRLKNEMNPDTTQLFRRALQMVTCWFLDDENVVLKYIGRGETH